MLNYPDSTPAALTQRRRNLQTRLNTIKQEIAAIDEDLIAHAESEQHA